MAEETSLFNLPLPQQIERLIEHDKMLMDRPEVDRVWFDGRIAGYQNVLGLIRPKCHRQIANGSYVPAQPHPWPGLYGLWQSFRCWRGRHIPGHESEGWFCAACLKQVRNC